MYLYLKLSFKKCDMYCDKNVDSLWNRIYQPIHTHKHKHTHTHTHIYIVYTYIYNIYIYIYIYIYIIYMYQYIDNTLLEKTLLVTTTD